MFQLGRELDSAMSVSVMGDSLWGEHICPLEIKPLDFKL
jgi:hypothetical protein